jgi:hypothetical protein
MGAPHWLSQAKIIPDETVYSDGEDNWNQIKPSFIK